MELMNIQVTPSRGAQPELESCGTTAAMETNHNPESGRGLGLQ